MMTQQPKTWLVTGNAGFIGSNLTEFLLAHNQKVVGLDNFSTGYRHNIEDVLASVGEENAKHFTFIESDIAAELFNRVITKQLFDQRRLAGAIAAAQLHSFAFTEVNIDTRKEGSVAIAKRQVFSIN